MLQLQHDLWDIAMSGHTHGNHEEYTYYRAKLNTKWLGSIKGLEEMYEYYINKEGIKASFYSDGRCSNLSVSKKYLKYFTDSELYVALMILAKKIMEISRELKDLKSDYTKQWTSRNLVIAAFEKATKNLYALYLECTKEFCRKTDIYCSVYF
jgi:hypothetical protein